MGRLKPGVSLDQANAEFVGLAKRMAKENPKQMGNWSRLMCSRSSILSPARNCARRLYAMLGAVLVVLLIACVNVMNMQFGRAALRAKELAIRGALGATRWRLVRQMLTESFLLAAMGAIVGVAMAFWAVDLLVRATNALPFLCRPIGLSFTIDAPVLVFTVVAVLSRHLSRSGARLVSSRTNAAEVMKEGGRGNSSRLVNVITRVLVVGQIAFTAALFIAATLQIKSIRNQMTLNYGYDENGVYCARMGLMEGDYPTPEARSSFLSPRFAFAPRESFLRGRGDDRPLPHDLRELRPVRSRWPNIRDRSRPAARQLRSPFRTIISPPSV